jgi:hypothetical protein
MPFNWREYLALAEQEPRPGTGFSIEAVHRSYVSRAYYAAFCHLMYHAAEKMGYEIEVEDPAKNHSKLRRFFRQDKRRSDIAQLLDDLRTARNQCDYSPDVPNLEQQLADSLARAREVFDWFRPPA